MNLDVDNLTQLLVIASKAIEAHDAERSVARASDALRAATGDLKDAMGISERLPADHPDWEHIHGATEAERVTLGQATRAAYNAKRRLGTAIRAYRGQGGN